MAITDSYKKLDEVIKDRDQKHAEFVRNILVIASTGLSILVTLHKTQCTSQLARVSFVITIISLAIGIITGALSLYRHVDASQKFFEQFHDAVIEQIRNDAERLKPVAVNPSIVFVHSDKVCFLALCIAVISLCVYAISIY